MACTYGRSGLLQMRTMVFHVEPSQNFHFPGIASKNLRVLSSPTRFLLENPLAM